MTLRQSSILVVDDDQDVLTAVRLLLKSQVKSVTTDSNPENLRRLLSQQNIDILMLDMNYHSAINTGNEGLFWLRQVKEWYPKLPVIMITAYGGIDLAVKSLKEGAADFIVKPWHNEKLLQTLQEIGEKQAGKKKIQTPTSQRQVEIIGESELMSDLFRKIEKVGPTDANVLILGENGTGKDLIAQAIYATSLRQGKPFVKVDVGALTESLFESELFGHKKGAFTDAREDRAGFIETASQGTLFLDEIGNINLQQQSKLLTVLQNRQVTRLGTNIPIPIDIRLISATNVPFEELANENHFRKDLIYRINTVEITVPPLRERKEDILLLANHFLRIYAQKYLKSALELSGDAENKLLQYNYPGNVRELQSTIERAVIMADGGELKKDDIVFSSIEKKIESNDLLQTHNLEELEKSAIIRVIEKYKGNISRAAAELGLTRAALYRRMEKYGI